MRLPLIAAAALLAGSAAYARDGASAPVISVDTLRQVTERLASDEFEGRAPATPGEEKTLAYLIERFAAAGLQPGNGGGWLQRVPLVELTARNVSPLTFTGGAAPVALEYRKDMVVSTYRVTPRIELKDSEVVFVGYGINAPERGWNDYEGVDVRGKTVVVLVNDPDWMSDGLDGPFGGAAMTYYGRWTYKFEEAARQGAAAAILVHDMFAASYDWGVVRSSWTRPQLAPDAPHGHGDQSAAVGWIQLDAAEALFASAGKDLTALSVAAGQKGFKAVPLGLEASVAFDNAIRREASNNVVAVLPGTERPGEAVLYMAHWDHLGRCDAVNGDDICNGAIDNAAGTAALVALAEAHAKAGPARRTLVFLAVTAEEAGLLGSHYYAEHPIYPLAQTVGGVNLDTLNLLGRTRDFLLAGAGKSELEELVEPFVAAQGRTIAPEPSPGAGLYYRSDHFSLAKLGVPMLYPLIGEDLVDGGRDAGRMALSGYALERYHKPQDEYDPGWDWSGAVEDLTVHYRLGRALAEGDMWPDWYADAEFRAIRDKSREAALREAALREGE